MELWIAPYANGYCSMEIKNINIGTEIEIVR